MLGDLHIHTRASDGSLLPHEILPLAKRSGIDCIAITNHDSIISLEEISHQLKELGLFLIDGVEISAHDPKTGRRVHILCYMPKSYNLVAPICKQTIENRMSAGLQMAEMVAKKYPITVDNVLEIAKDSECVYKQHISHALMNAGYTTKIFGDLYDELFDFKNGTCIVNCKSPDVMDVISAVKQSGGFCVMAHPFTYDSIDLLNNLLKENFLDGIEVWSSKSNRDQEEYLFKLAQTYNVIPTGGSDFHGAYGSRISPIGGKSTPQSSVESIIERQTK